jgi:hypothetical protein
MSNLTRYRGDTRADIITVTRKSTGVAVDITGGSFKLTVDPEQNPTTSTSNLFALSGVIIDALVGTVAFSPSTLQADQLPGAYFYDIQYTDSAGLIETIAKGKYVFLQDISK